MAPPQVVPRRTIIFYEGIFNRMPNAMITQMPTIRSIYYYQKGTPPPPPPTPEKYFETVQINSPQEKKTDANK
jgi:hypothetical protein